MANGRCYRHGGASLGGVASPSFRTGRYSRYIPGKLLERYRARLSDPDLLALRSEISLVDARISGLLERVDSGESRAAWEKLSKTWKAMLQARAHNEPGLMQLRFREIERLISGGLSAHAVWSEIHSAIDQRRRLVESEYRRMEAMGQLMTAEQALALVALLSDAVKRHVRDRETLRAISGELARCTNLDGPRRD